MRETTGQTVGGATQAKKKKREREREREQLSIRQQQTCGKNPKRANE